ncbi:MAG TPA: hypothetical protein VMT82_02295 [candidate division Zixibacteria bacterium]|nr:hypothetical protein [candidate division Zixibacteria bacterium]
MTTSSNRPLVAAFFSNTIDAENAIKELRDRGFTSSQIGTSLEPVDEMGIFSEAGAGPAEILRKPTEHKGHRSFWEKVRDFFSAESDDFGTRAHERTQVTDNEFGAIRFEGYNIPERFHSRLESGTYVIVESSRMAEAEDILSHNHGELDRDFATGIRENAAVPEAGIRRIQIISVVLRGSTGKGAKGDDRKVA